MTGDLEREPVEGVDSLEDLAAALDPVKEGEQGDAESEAEEAAEEEQEEVEEEEGAEEEEEDPTVVIKHDGREVQLKLSEVKDLAQQGFDYSKKTMALAEEKTAVAATKTQADTYRKQYEETLGQTRQRLVAFEQFMESQVGDPPPVEWASQDVAYYLAQKELHESKKGQLQNAREAIKRVDEEAQRERQARLANQADETEKALRDTLPDWNDDTLSTLAKYAESIGITPESAGDAFVTKGLWIAIHKAKAHDAIQAQKAQMKPKEKLAKVVKPSAANPVGKAAERAKREAAFSKNPSVDALADLLR